jgi:hypothetical protein
MNEFGKMRKWFLVDLKEKECFYAPMLGLLPDTEKIVNEWGNKFQLIEYYNENIIYNVNLYRFGAFHQVDYNEKPLYHNIITNFTKGETK